MIRFAAAAALACVCTPALCGPQGTYPVPDALVECPYAVTIGGEDVPIEKAGVYQGAYYVRFPFRSKVTVEVRVKATASTSCTLKPERFRTNQTGINGAGTRFDIDSPGPRVITTVCGSREQWPIIIFAEKPPYPTPTAVATYTVSPAWTTGLHTTDFQKVLDDCAAQGGGIVRFPSGVYLTGPLFVRDNTTVLLEPGCLIQGSDRAQDYKTDKQWNAYGSHGATAGLPALINFRDCKNSRLIGRGVIDGAGHIVREHGYNVSLLTVCNSENIEVRDVVLRNSPSWTVHAFGSKNLVFDGLKLVNDWAVGNTDGINPDCSQNVTISDYFGYCGDDAVAIKNTSADPRLQGCSKIRVYDCVVMTRKTCYKLGTESHKDTNDVVFERCESVNSSRGIGIYMRDGGIMSDIKYSDMNLDLMEYPGEGSSGAPFTIVVEKRYGLGKIQDIRFEHVDASAPYNSGIFGREDSRIEGLTFADCSLEIRNRSIKMRKVPVFDVGYCDNVAFGNFSVRWATDLPEMWDGFVKTTDCVNVTVEGLKESGK